MEIDKRLLAPLALLGFLIADVHPGIAGMENVRFCLHRKPAFSPTESVPSLCDDPATTTVEPNYSPNFDNLPCDEYTVNAPLGPSTVYVVVAQAGDEGVAAVSFGVHYNGSDPDGLPGTGDETGIVSSQTNWTMCANGLMFPNNDGIHGDFPDTGGGVRITWNTQTSCANQVIGNKGVHAVVGCFQVYAYSPTVMGLSVNDNIQSGVPELAVVDCSGKTTDLYPLLGPVSASAIVGRVQFGTGSGAYNPCTNVVPVLGTTWGALKHLYQ
jgi:hypothetical protein